MRINVASISEIPLEGEESVSASSWDIDRFDVKFLDNIWIKYKVVKANEEVLVSAKIIVIQEITCSRCLDEVRRTVEYDFSKSYLLNKLPEYLDFSNDTREEVLLNFPMKVLCGFNCKGICVHCGVNLNHEKCRCIGRERN